METVTITVPAQYERMISKILEIAADENELYADLGSRIVFAQQNIKWLNSSKATMDQKHTTICTAVAHLILALDQMES